jgi:quercetin dioxygenase-like cupin family protein
MNSSASTVLKSNEGLRLQSAPGRDLIFKLTGEETAGAFDYFIVEVAPHGGPPLHVHHKQEETLHVIKGKFKVRIGDEIFYLNEGDFAYLPSNVPHAFLNLTDEGDEVIVVYTPGGGLKFFEELGPLMHSTSPDKKVIAQLFEKYAMTLLGPPLSLD